MQRTIRILGWLAAAAATPVMAQPPETPEEPEPAAAAVEEPAEERTEPEGESTEESAEPAQPAEPAPPPPPVEETLETPKTPPDGGPLPSEDRPSEPVSPEDDLLSPAPPADEESAAADDEDDLTVPVQVPVPPPPDRAVEAHPEIGRATRLLDITTNLTELVARDGPFAVQPRYGGVADQLVLRGATGAAASDLAVTLDGVPIAVPFAGRAVGYTDLELLPVAAIDGFRIHPGPFDGSYAGSVQLRSRRLSGVEGSLMLGERGHQRLGLVAGRSDDRGDVLMGVEVRRAPHQLAGVTDERFATLVRATHQLGEDLHAGVMLRGYTDGWDEPGTVPRAAPALTPDRDPSDGGRLLGLGAALTLGWTPTSTTHLDVSLSFLDDRWTRWSSLGGEQREQKDRDRVWYASALLHLEPKLALPTHAELGLDIAFDNMRTRTWRTAARERLFLAEEINGRWLDVGVHGAAEIAFLDELFVGARLRASQLTVRREDAAAGSPDTRRELLPTGALWIALRFDRIGGQLQIGESHRTAPDAVRGDHLTVDHDSADLSVFGRFDLGEQWRIDWHATGFVSLYEAGLLAADATTNERQLWGVEARLDLEHVPSGLLVVGRGGPWFSSLRGSEERSELDAAGVPDYVMHVGLLRSAPRGLVAEVWLDAYGSYALTNTTGGGRQDEFIDVSARAGWRAAWGTIWLGAKNLLDDDDVVATGAPDRAELRPGRAIYGMLDLRI